MDYVQEGPVTSVDGELSYVRYPILAHSNKEILIIKKLSKVTTNLFLSNRTVMLKLNIYQINI